MYQTLRKLGYFKFSDEFKKSGINNVGYMRCLILRKSSKSGLRLLSDDDCFYEVMKHSRVYGLVHIYAELVPLLVNDLDGSNDFPNREKGQFGQNGGVGLNEGVAETFSEGFEYAEDFEVSMLPRSHSSDDDADVGKEGKVPGYEIDHSASSDPGNYDSSDSEAEDTGQLLYAIGRDGNNQMFPISWGVVELQSAVTWKRFLDHLMADPNVANGGEGLTIFPDMKKVPQCDDVGNNIMKAFNGWILDARAKLTKCFKIFGKNRVEAGDWALEYNGDDGYVIIKEVRLFDLPLKMPLQKLRRSLDDREEIEDKTKRSQGRKENRLVRVATRHARIAVKLGITRGVVNNLKELARKLTEIVVQPAVTNKEVKKSKNSLCIKLTKKRIIIPGPLKMKNADTGSTVHQASTAAKLNQPAQASTYPSILAFGKALSLLFMVGKANCESVPFTAEGDLVIRNSGFDGTIFYNLMT
ncbi:hypothetical protein POTOM_031614 [Populus tomentosa]|uniref:Uncharacterized protein n=1 Tax=Populus tomentosa TaxID=118781 RepID=A0A8X7ZIW3_POPTO|nr:hypothetical protein POTOM_031614 [Populus tomentosa]